MDHASGAATRLQWALRNAWLQAAVLAVGILAAYRYAFFDVARADQLVYLYRTADVHSFWTLTAGAYDYNRVGSVGDFKLFRPFYFVLLGLERWAWGYNFVAWQATSIAVHITVVLSLFVYFRYVCRRALKRGEDSFAPFVLAMFFGLMYAGTELVAWHHMVGYLFYCLLTILTLLAYQRFLDRRDGLSAAFLVLSATLSCFTYEIGNVVVGLLGAVLAATLVMEAWPLRNLAAAIRGNITAVATAVLLMCAPLFYATVSYLDYVARIGETQASEPPSLSALHVIWLGLQSFGFWLLSIFDPGSLELLPGSRIYGQIFTYPPLLGAAFACVIVACAIFLAVRRSTSFDVLRNGLPGFTLITAAIAFGLVIAIGRGSAFGEDYVIEKNTYYVYIFAFFVLVAFFHLIVFPAVGEKSRSLIVARRVMYAAIGAIALISGMKVYKLHETMYLTYSGPIANLIEQIETLKAQHGKEPDFSYSLATDCGAIYLAPWLADQGLGQHQRYTIATALFPRDARDLLGKYVLQCPPFWRITGIYEAMLGQALDGVPNVDRFTLNVKCAFNSPSSQTFAHDLMEAFRQHDWQVQPQDCSSRELRGDLTGVYIIIPPIYKGRRTDELPPAMRTLHSIMTRAGIAAAWAFADGLRPDQFLLVIGAGPFL